MVKIEVKNLVKIFGNHPEKGLQLLKKGMSKDEIQEKTGQVVGIGDISFSVEEGTIFVIMGLSGSGKSTVIRCINRLHEPTSGSILVDGIDITAMTREELRKLRVQKMGMVFQRFALFPHRTVLKNAAYGLEVQGVPVAEQKERAKQALALVGLEGWEESFPDQLSGGMQQRVGLARALAINPDILLMDEAFSALDPLIRKEMQEELLDLQNKMNKTILFITHDLDEALRLGDKIVLMKDGKIVQVGTAEDILMSPADDYVAKFVEDVDMAKVLKVADVMVKPAEVAFPTDGPKTVLRKMKNANISSIFTVNRGRLLQGVVTVDDVAQALEQGEKSIPAESIQREFPVVSPEATLKEALNVMDHNRSIPLAVTENDKLVGVLVKGAILAGLAGRENAETMLSRDPAEGVTSDK